MNDEFEQSQAGMPTHSADEGAPLSADRQIRRRDLLKGVLAAAPVIVTVKAQAGNTFATGSGVSGLGSPNNGAPTNP